MKHMTTILLVFFILISVRHSSSPTKIKMEDVGQVYNYKYPIQSYVEFQKYLPSGRVIGSGSGFVFHRDQFKNNYILTNYHVCYNKHGERANQRILDLAGSSSAFD
jgi:S1-C subfamily serine protease